jgi:hypothetical protein
VHVRAALALVLTVASCTSSDDEHASTTDAEPTQRVEPPPPPVRDNRPIVELGPLVGGARQLSTPTAGRYALSMRAGQWRALTMDLTMEESLIGGASLELREDGSAHACFWGTSQGTGKITKYASDDGRPHTNRTTTTFRSGMWGKWEPEPESARATIQFDIIEPRTCDPSAEHRRDFRPSYMTCHALAANDELPVPALICRLELITGSPSKLTMALEPNPRTGPWAIAEDPTLRYPRAFGPEVKPWLLLGAPGLLITASDDREREPMTVSFAAADVPTPRGRLEDPTYTQESYP